MSESDPPGIPTPPVVTPPGWARTPAREALSVWAGLVAVLAVASVTIGLVPYGKAVVGALAVGLFLWVPGWVNDRVGRDEPDGLDSTRWGPDALFALVVMLLVFPAFTAGFRAFLWANDHVVPAEIARYLSPYGVSAKFTWRLPDRLLDVVGGNIAVAVGEEFFYRGWLTKRLETAWPVRTRLFGDPFGKAHVVATALFAAGHLLRPDAFRLATFFPGLLFAWMASRSGRLGGPIIVHACSNMLIATLEASAFGHLRAPEPASSSWFPALLP